MEFVNFEVAKHLKTLGFNKLCHAYFRYILGTTEVIFYADKDEKSFDYNNLESRFVYFSAPTIKEALEWLSENMMRLRNDFIHPELKDGEIFLLNVYTNEEFGVPKFCVSTRLGNVAYTTGGEEIVENAKPLFGLLKK